MPTGKGAGNKPWSGIFLPAPLHGLLRRELQARQMGSGDQPLTHLVRADALACNQRNCLITGGPSKCLRFWVP